MFLLSYKSRRQRCTWIPWRKIQSQWRGCLVNNCTTYWSANLLAQAEYCTSWYQGKTLISCNPVTSLAELVLVCCEVEALTGPPRGNRLFLSSKNCRFQNEAKCKNVLVLMSFICMATRKWPIRAFFIFIDFFFLIPLKIIEDKSQINVSALSHRKFIIGDR